MSAFTQLIYHIVFSTKFRQQLIYGQLQEKLYDYIGGIVRAKKGHLIEIGGMKDHIHLLVSLPPAKSISEFIREIKANSSKWYNQTFSSIFEWQKGYGAFTVSYSQLETVQSYIQNQKLHHRKKSFEDEYIAFLKAHNIQFNSNNVFEEKEEKISEKEKSSNV